MLARRRTCQDLEVVLSFVEPLQAAQALGYNQPQSQGKACELFMAGTPPLDRPLQAVHCRIIGILELPVLILQLCKGFPASCTVGSSLNTMLQVLQVNQACQ